MALSTQRAKQGEKSGLDILCESAPIIADILFRFRECHDICVESQLFKDSVIEKIDQCAVDFRQLSLDTVSVAQRASNQWLEEAIAFFQSIDDIDNPAEMMTLLGGQARDLAKCFKVIAAWARDLCGRLHQAQDGTIKEAEEFKRRFKEAQERAESHSKKMKEREEKARKELQAAEEEEDRWKIARSWTSWNPIGLIVTTIGTSVAESRRKEVSDLEAEAYRLLQDAKAELKRKETQKEKADVSYAHTKQDKCISSYL